MTAPFQSRHILIVDSDASCRKSLCSHLKSEGFALSEAGSIATGLARLADVSPDLMVVDVDLPDGLGFDLVRTARRRHDCACIYVTRRATTDDRVRGLEDGGDDYIVKPVDPRELTARIRAVLRRYHRTPDPRPDPVITFSGWTLDLVRRELADAQGELIRLTRAEFDLFAALAQTGAQPLSRDYLVEVVSSAESETRERTIDVMVSRIRRKLARARQPAPQIITQPGQGYRFRAPCPTPA